MNRYGPDPKEAAEIAKASGCRIARSEQLHDGSWSHRILCNSHAAKVRFLANLAEYDSRLPDIRRLAERVAAGAPNARAQAAALQRFVQQRVTFTKEPQETFSPTWRTLEHGLGDCDDSSRALLALARSLGLPAGLRTVPELGSAVPTHVAAALRDGEEWIWLEASIPARFGEHPQHAARRLKSERPDIAKGLQGLAQPEAEIALHFTPQQKVLFGGALLATLASFAAPTIAPAALAIGGAAIGYGGTEYPMLREFEANGFTCDTFLPGVFEKEEPGQAAACEKQWGYLKARNAAIGAVAGGLAGWALRRWKA